MASANGRRVLASRRRKGRKKLTVSDETDAETQIKDREVFAGLADTFLDYACSVT